AVVPGQPADIRQRSRPYLFSNTVAPTIVSGTLKALEMMSRSADLRQKLLENTRHFRQGITRLGFHIRAGEHPIVPIMLGEAGLSQRFAAHMLEKGVYVVGFFFPVVPQGSARIRVQLSAAHSKADLDMALEAFAETGKELEML
ncbi:MAG: aminotransferase class I/II-fold pyridoxal phosphate-dependent enzyme, partial [Syntrophales bacterium]|nr:aminotransferase class I/II-fold pyridoxal phosphate-dependent enzyme [Syntrophales bacterium]